MSYYCSLIKLLCIIVAHTSFCFLCGVFIVIFESGMHLSVQRVFNKEIGPHVLVIASLGTCLPIFLGVLCMYILGSDVYPNALAAGFSLAPTSVGISLTLLSVSKQLNTNLGQIIMSSAFLDDIYSIICLVVMINLAKGDFSPAEHVIQPLFSSFALVGFGVVGKCMCICMYACMCK